MKKVITIMCVAAAPILFAQEKSLKANTNESVKVEQEAKIKSAEAKKLQEQNAQAEKAKKKSEIKATQNKNSGNNAAALEANKVNSSKKK